MNNPSEKKQLKNKKNSSPSFQSDIVINEDGEIFISFFGPELLHLLDRTIEFDCNRNWSLPEFAPGYFDKTIKLIKNEYQNCLLCPKECGYDRVKNAHPNCGDWELKISNFGISFGDEKEISNGGGSGVLFLNGCPLTCPSCINEEKVRDNTSMTSIEACLKMCESLYQKGANNIQILSPSVSLPHLRTILQLLKNLSFPLPIILKSSGHESLKELKKLEGLVDIYIPDYKFSTSRFWEKESGANRYHETFIECLEEMYRQVGSTQKNEKDIITKGVMIRHVLNPFLKADEKKIISEFLSAQKKDIHVSILDNFVILD